jgi:hypothetical protein
MPDPLVLKAGDYLLPFTDVKQVEIHDIERELAIIEMKNGDRHYAEGFDAIEAVMALKPSALEGRRLRWHRSAWAFHNLVGHPVLQVLAWLGFKKAAIRFHDYTTPTPRGAR